MASGNIRNKKTKKVYQVKNVEAVMKSNPRTFEAIPPKQLPKEIAEVEKKMDVAPIETTKSKDIVEEPKPEKKQKRNPTQE